MEEALCRIAFAFEQIANSLERIEAEGLNVNLSGLNLQGPLRLEHEFSEKLSIAVCNQSIGFETYPFTIESK